MVRSLIGLLVFGLLLAARTASAHFLWLYAEPEAKPAQVSLWFSETVVPGEAKLLDKIAHAKTWLVTLGQAPEPLELKKDVQQDQGGWTADVKSSAPFAVETTCDYGVLNRGGKFLLQYHAKCLASPTDEALEELGRSQRLVLDIRPRVLDGDVVLQVVHNGIPAANAELKVVLPDNEEVDVRLDDQGIGRIEKAAPGEYAALAKLVIPTAGVRDGKDYDEVRHYSTATFTLPGKGASAKPAARTVAVATVKPDPAAVKMLEKTRAKRAVWENFGGFKANITVRLDGKEGTGTIEVDEYGSAAVEIEDKQLRDWAEEQAGSLVQHRLPSDFGTETPTFADNETNHPLGRKLQLGHPKFESAYRIQDGVVTEVNRKVGPTMRFTISVLETITNKDGKYLPRVFTMTTWDTKTGEIKSNSTMLNTWTRVGDYDVPDRVIEVRSTPGDQHVREIILSDYELLNAK